MSQQHILVVDDDTRLRRLLRQYLTENGFNVDEASNGDEAFELMKIVVFDLIIMDVMMPGTNGQDIVKRMREEGNQSPVLMLTAMGDTDDRINGLESGADDYLSKPFEPRELVLRMNNILKRFKRADEREQLSFGECVFNPKTGILMKSGEVIPLTGGELDLLRVLAQHPGDAVSREDLGTLTHTDNTRAVDVQITRLRKKIETDISHPVCIQTARGQGYLLVVQ